MARTPDIKLIIKKKNVTSELQKILISMTISNKVHGDADSIELVFTNYNFDWFTYPTLEKGDEVYAELFYQEKPEERWISGSFKVDAISFKGSPTEGDTVQVSGQSASVKKSLREIKTHQWENTTLKDIVTAVATKHFLTLDWMGENISFKRITQDKQTDLEFVLRLADKYGFRFNLRDDILLFHKWQDLKDADAKTTLERDNLNDYSISYNAQQVYKEATATSYDPKSKKAISHTAKPKNAVKSNDTLHVNTRLEDAAQAKEVAKAKLDSNNAKEITIDVNLEGTHIYYAGMNVQLDGFGRLNQKALIAEVTQHISTTTGWTTHIVSNEEKKTTKKPTDTPYPVNPKGEYDWVDTIKSYTPLRALEVLQK